MRGLLPVTTQPPFCPGFWGSPYGRPQRIEMRHYPHGFALRKGCWMVRTGTNRVELRYHEECWREIEEQCGPPGTGMLRPPPGWRPPGPPRPPKPPRPPYKPHYHFDDDGILPASDDDADDLPETHVAHYGRDVSHGSNSGQRWELVRQNSTGTVFADGWSVRIVGAGDALIIQVL